MEAIDNKHEKKNQNSSKDSKSIEQGMEELGSKVSRLATQASERFAETGEKLVADVKEKSAVYFHDLEKYIKNNPIQASLIAAGIGFLVARNMNSKS